MSESFLLCLLGRAETLHMLGQCVAVPDGVAVAAGPQLLFLQAWIWLATLLMQAFCADWFVIVRQVAIGRLY